MNPSAKGWIAKFGHIIKDQPQPYSTFEVLYNSLRLNGFVYGFNSNLPQSVKKSFDYSPDEIAKINLINALYYTFAISKPENDYSDFSKDLLSFYKTLEFQNKSIWKRLTGGMDKGGKLEMLITERVQIGENMFARSFQKSIANALLFVDVLTFKAYIERNVEVKTYAADLENIIINISFNAGSHISKHGNDDLGKKYSALFKESYFFSRSKTGVNKENKKFFDELTDAEKRYLIDLTCAICYSDYDFSEVDKTFVSNLVREMKMDEIMGLESMNVIEQFYAQNKKLKKQVSGSNPVFNFYDNSSVYIVKLIQRNKSRIVKEVQHSKELMSLIGKSRKRALTIEEQKKIQVLLLDILKTIPSFAIFILPGGAILLPLFAKILPNLLPSSFDDNKI
ncbi:LETM1-like protein [Flavobacteriaceae bacterium MAR_2010_188]|nr:LETM1-like protein [Flavobacteriaceae bacterium MAR_2010_188]